jgi:hypothetical protein
MINFGGMTVINLWPFMDGPCAAALWAQQNLLSLFYRYYRVLSVFHGVVSSSRRKAEEE